MRETATCQTEWLSLLAQVRGSDAGIGRFGNPEEIAELLAFLVSPAAKWLTGTSVRMDGGEIKGI